MRRERPRTLTADEVAQVRRWCRHRRLWRDFIFLPLVIVTVLISAAVVVISVMAGHWLAVGATALVVGSLAWLFPLAGDRVGELDTVTTATPVVRTHGTFDLTRIGTKSFAYTIDDRMVMFVHSKARRALVHGDHCEAEWIDGHPPLVLTARPVVRRKPWQGRDAKPSKRRKRRRR